jgi:hypothetical protein
MYEMSQRHPVWVSENHINPCKSVDRYSMRYAYLWSLHAITLKIWLGDSNHASYKGGRGGG